MESYYYSWMVDRTTARAGAKKTSLNPRSQRRTRITASTKPVGGMGMSRTSTESRSKGAANTVTGKTLQCVRTSWGQLSHGYTN